MMTDKYKHQVPENYFDDLKNRLKQIPEKHLMSPQKGGNRYVWSGAIAASLLVSLYFIKPRNTGEDMGLDDLSDGLIISYLEKEPDVLFNNDIYLDDIDFKGINTDIESIDEKDLEDYLEEHLEY